MTTSSGSLYEQLFPLTTVMKQRFVENFSGDALDTDRWSTDQLSGGSTVAMADTVDGGVLITSGGTSNAKATMAFNDKRQFSHLGSVFIGVHKFSTTQATTIYTLGFSTADTNPRSVPQNAALFSCSTGGTDYYVESGDGSSFNSVNPSTAVNTSYRTGKLALDGTGIDFSIDGVFSVRKTTAYPTTKMQPVIHLNSDVVKTINVKYMECYNT